MSYPLACFGLLDPQPSRASRPEMNPTHRTRVMLVFMLLLQGEVSPFHCNIFGRECLGHGILGCVEDFAL